MRVMSWMVLFCYLCFLVGGCAAGRAFSAGESYEAEGKYEEAMFSYAEAFRCDPEAGEYRVRFLSARDRAANERYKRGTAKAEQGDYAAALVEFQTAYGLDPSQGVYKQLVEETSRKRDAQQAFREGAELEKANKLKDARRFYTRAADLCPEQKEYKESLERVTALLSNKPAGFELNLKSLKPFTFKLRETRLKDSFRILTQLSGITFLFDEAVKEHPVSISLEKTNFQQVLDLLLTMNKLGCKTLNETTLLVYPRTPEKTKQYEEMQIRTFHLNYMDAKKAVNLVRTMVPTRKIHVNEEANSLVVRDTSDVIAVIEKLLDANDNPDAEVLLDVEVLELSDKNTRNVGLVLSRYAVDLGPFNLSSGQLLADKLSSATTTTDTTTEAGISNLVNVFNWNGYGGFVTVPNATYNFSKTVAKGEVLSNPKLRVKNKEKAKFNIGTRVPITTTTTNGTATGYSVNVQYVDVGVKVDAEPMIQLNNDIVIKVALEVSSIVGKEKLGDGTTTVVTIGTRNLQTVLSLKDGETSVIGGLISRTNTDSKTKVFLLGDIPLIGPLLSGNDTSKDKTELVLAITPSLVRGVVVSPHNLASFMSGKEDDPSLGMFPASPDQNEDMDGEKKKTDKTATGKAAFSQTGAVGALPVVPVFPVPPGIVTPQPMAPNPLPPAGQSAPVLEPATAQQATVSPALPAKGIGQPVAPQANAVQPGMNATTPVVNAPPQTPPQPAGNQPVSPVQQSAGQTSLPQHPTNAQPSAASTPATTQGAVQPMVMKTVSPQPSLPPSLPRQSGARPPAALVPVPSQPASQQQVPDKTAGSKAGSGSDGSAVASQGIQAVSPHSTTVSGKQDSPPQAAVPPVVNTPAQVGPGARQP